MSGFIGFMSVFHPRNVGYTAQWFKSISHVQPTLYEVSGQRPHECVCVAPHEVLDWLLEWMGGLPNVVSSGLIVGGLSEFSLSLPLLL